ncbi:MAG: hybrid sensor histidine kinase/response regulator [Planctomycetota bacterium]|nr:MAG: hybrid sensor histidine kinase/response regulator [Planctomycetota bacterium]
MKRGVLPLIHRDLVFVVDDEDALRLTLGRKLERSGWRVETFASPAPALERMESVLPVVVVSDLVMPGMTGIDLLRVSRQRHGPDVPAFIIMTAYSSAESAQEALELGAFDYLLKPFAPRLLIDRLRQAVALVDLALQRAVLGSVLADDLRAPLGAIEMSLHALERGELGALDEAQREVVRLARTECGRMHRLVHHLDDLLMLERGDMYQRPVRLRLRALLENAARRLEQRLIDFVPIELDLEGLGDLEIEGDRDLALRLCEALLLAAHGEGEGRELERRKLQAVRREDTVEIRLGPFDPLPFEAEASLQAAIDPTARRRLLDAGVRINTEMELSFGRRAAQALGGSLRVEPAQGGSHLVLALPVVKGERA